MKDCGIDLRNFMNDCGLPSQGFHDCGLASKGLHEGLWTFISRTSQKIVKSHHRIS